MNAYDPSDPASGSGLFANYMLNEMLGRVIRDRGFWPEISKALNDPSLSAFKDILAGKGYLLTDEQLNRLVPIREEIQTRYGGLFDMTATKGDMKGYEMQSSATSS